MCEIRSIMCIKVFKYITKEINYDDIYKAIRLINDQPIPKEIIITMGRRCGKSKLVRDLFGII